MKAKGTPLLTFYENWSKINKIQKRKRATQNDELAEKLPMIKRPKADEDRSKKSQNKGPAVLFPSDSEDEGNFGFDGEAEEKPAPKKEKVKKLKKKKPTKKVEIDMSQDYNDEADMVQEINVNDW